MRRFFVTAPAGSRLAEFDRAAAVLASAEPGGSVAASTTGAAFESSRLRRNFQNTHRNFFMLNRTPTLILTCLQECLFFLLGFGKLRTDHSYYSFIRSARLYLVQTVTKAFDTK